MNQTESVLRGALEMAIRCIKGEIPADGYMGDVQLLAALERTLAIPDGGEPSQLEQTTIGMLGLIQRAESRKLEQLQEQPKLRDIFAMAFIHSPMSFPFNTKNDDEAFVKWAYSLADTMLRYRASGQ